MDKLFVLTLLVVISFIYVETKVEATKQYCKTLSDRSINESQKAYQKATDVENRFADFKPYYDQLKTRVDKYLLK